MSATSTALVLWTPSFTPPGSGASSRSNSLGGSVSPWFAALMGAADAEQAVSPLPSRPSSSLSRPVSSPHLESIQVNTEHPVEKPTFSATSLSHTTHEDPSADSDVIPDEHRINPFNTMFDNGFTISRHYLALMQSTTALPTPLSLSLRLPIEVLQADAGPRIVELDPDVEMSEPPSEDDHKMDSSNSVHINVIPPTPKIPDICVVLPPTHGVEDKIVRGRELHSTIGSDLTPPAALQNAPYCTSQTTAPEESQNIPQMTPEKQVEASRKKAGGDIETNKLLEVASSSSDGASSFDSQEDWPLLKPAGRFVFPNQVDIAPSPTCMSFPTGEIPSGAPTLATEAHRPSAPNSVSIMAPVAVTIPERFSAQPSLDTCAKINSLPLVQIASPADVSTEVRTQPAHQRPSSPPPQLPSTPPPQARSAAVSSPKLAKQLNTTDLPPFLDDGPEQYSYPSPFEDASSSPQAEIKIKNTIPKRQVTLMRKSPSPDDHEQWRVGKTPGHQGSHARGKRRVDGDDEKYDSARVLKRPFRPPTRIAGVTVKKVKPMVMPVPPSSEAGSDVPSSPPSNSSTSIPSTSSRLPTTRVSKPFLPLVRSAAPSPPSIKSSPSQRASSFGKLRLKPIDPNAPVIAALETRLRILRQAVKYTTEGEDDRLASLVATWREAGREITDRLFALLPQPVDSNTGTSGWDMGWTDKSDRGREYEHNHDVRGHTGDNHEDDILKILEQAGGRSPPREWGMDLDRNQLSDEEDEQTYQEATWDRGAMLLRLGVDPDLLGFDREADDWKEIDDDEE